MAVSHNGISAQSGQASIPRPQIGTRQKEARLAYFRAGFMREPKQQPRRLSELMALLGTNPNDEIAPINRHLFARKLGQIIARARTNVEARLSGEAKRKPRDERSE